MALRRGGLNHLDLTVSDLARSVPFYDRVLGALGYARTGEYAGGIPCWIIADGMGAEFSIGLHAARSDRAHDRYATGLHHLAFHAESRAAVDDFHAFLVRHAVTVLDPPAEYDYTPGYYAVFFADPDGLKLELVYEPRLQKKGPE
jgi:catechol 2,3-dioxygenase-like lactoylglutathione lyase family enzyme